MRVWRLLCLVVAVWTATLGGFAAKNVGGEAVRVEPPYWWVEMENDTLQVMVSGPGVAAADFAVDYPGVVLAEQVKLDSPNYKLLYFRILPEAKPGVMRVRYVLDGKKRSFDYELKKRDRGREEYTGFDAGDVLYLLMPDRFAKGQADGKARKRAKASKGPKDAVAAMDFPVGPDRDNPDGRHGGNIAGIAEHLGYLDSLGVTAIWLCPVLENDMPGGSYHGYATTDYYRIDPRFGTNEQYGALIDKAHGRGMKVVMDMIFNHTGSNHPWMKDMPSKDWYNNPEGDVMTNFRLTTVHDPYVSDYDLKHTVDGWFVPAMPDLNQRNPHLMKYLIQNSIWWIESAKIDGIRMDTYPYADMVAMSRWAGEVLREYPNFNIVGESWYATETGGAYWQRHSRLNPKETSLPSVMDFYFVTGGRKAFEEDTDPWHGLNNLYDHLSQDFLYPDPMNLLTFLDNHDSDRFLLEEPKDLAKWKQAVAFLLTSRGIPQIYYGTEILMHGSKEGSDGYVRRDFPGGFAGDPVNAFTAQGRTPLQNEAWDYMSKILNWRKNEARDVMAKGSLKHCMPQNGLYVYQRKFGDKEVTVILNGRDSEQALTMERSAEMLPYGITLRDIITDKPVTITETMTFAPRQVFILQNF